MLGWLGVDFNRCFGLFSDRFVSEWFQKPLAVSPLFNAAKPQAPAEPLDKTTVLKPSRNDRLSRMSERRAVYAGSFDPITSGHLWMIEHGARLFDELVVAIGINPDKKYLFSLEERLMMLRDACKPFANVRVASFENLFLVHYAREVNAGFILRGIRNEVDYGYERGMRYINAELNNDVMTTFLMPPREYAEISSSFVKGLVGPAGWEQVVQKYVPAGVHAKFVERFSTKR